MSLPNELQQGESSRFFTLSAIGLLIVVAIATAVSWHVYPLFIDTYYHMGVIEGFSQAGGITTRAFWEMAPGGRVHIYPPSLHAIGYLFSLIGVAPRTFITLASATFYAGCLLTTWIWLRRIIGPRSALFALIFLFGPYAFFWTQASFNAIAGAMVLAPLALLALETERFLACAVLNFVAITMHPMGLFLAPALVINTLLRRKRIIAGLFAACLPVVLYGPWLAHIWANRAFLPDSRTGGDVSLGGFGVGGLNLGIFLAAFAVLSIPWLIKRRGQSLGLIGPLLGFAVVFPMGFGGRFFAFNIHWPLACLAGYGLGELLGWLEQRAWLRAGGQILAVVLATIALVAYPAIEMPLPRSEGGPGGPPMGGRAQAGAGRVGRMTQDLRSMLSSRRVTMQAGALSNLFQTYSGEGPGMGMGMAPGPGGGRGGFPGGPPGRSARSTVGPREVPDARLGGGTGPERAMAAQGRRPDSGAFPGPGSQPGSRTQAGTGRGTGPGMPGTNQLSRAGADEFFQAVKTNVRPGDVIYVDDGTAGSLLVGVTGRWTSSGILRDVRADNARARPQDCDFVAVFSGGMGMMGPGGARASQDETSGFEKFFENEYGSLSRNTAKVEHAREPLKPAVSLRLLLVMTAVGVWLILLDLLPNQHVRVRRFATVIGSITAAVCFLPLTSSAVAELRNPPVAPIGQRGDGPGFGGPGPGRLGPGGPGFTGAGLGPGQFLGLAFLREADADESATVSLEEFKTLAGRWFQSWDTERDGSLQLREVSQGLKPALSPPPDTIGPARPLGLPLGFDPEELLARRIFFGCDSSADGRLTREEMISGFEKWFREWDVGTEGSLDAKALGVGLDRLFGPPPMIGEPGPRDEGPPPGPPGG